MKHRLDVISVMDGNAVCSCGGWTFAPSPGNSIFRLDIEDAHRKHRFEMGKAGRLHGYQVFGAKHGNKRITRGTLDARHGTHSGLNLIVASLDGDLLEMRPLKSPKRITVSIFDVYNFAIKKEADARRMEKWHRSREKSGPRIARLRRLVQRHKLKEL